MVDLPSSPLWLQGGTYTADDDRALLRALIPLQGVVESSHLAVTANGTPNMSVNVAPGRAYVQRTGATDFYLAEVDTTTNLTVSAADPTNPRKDIVVLRVYDAAYSGSANKATLEVIAGTPAASPAEPAVPNNAIKLAVITVGAGAASITSGNISDTRAQTVPRGGVLPVANAAARTALTPYLGMHVIEADTKREYVWDGAAWQLGMDSPVVMRAVLSVDQPVGASWTNVGWSETEDSHNAFTNGTFTCPVGGLYLCTAAAWWLNVAAGDARYTALVVNGTRVTGRVAWRAPTTAAAEYQYTKLVRLASGDVVTLGFYAQTSDTLKAPVGDSGTTWELIRVGR